MAIVDDNDNTDDSFNDIYEESRLDILPPPALPRLLLVHIVIKVASQILVTDNPVYAQPPSFSAIIQAAQPTSLTSMRALLDSISLTARNSISNIPQNTVFYELRIAWRHDIISGGSQVPVLPTLIPQTDTQLREALEVMANRGWRDHLLAIYHVHNPETLSLGVPEPLEWIYPRRSDMLDPYRFDPHVRWSNYGPGYRVGSEHPQPSGPFDRSRIPGLSYVARTEAAAPLMSGGQSTGASVSCRSKSFTFGGSFSEGVKKVCEWSQRPFKGRGLHFVSKHSSLLPASDWMTIRCQTWRVPVPAVLSFVA